MSPVAIVAITLALFGTVTYADPLKPAADVQAEAKLMVSQVRQLVDQARNGVHLQRLRQDVLALQAAASDLSQLLPADASGSEAQTIIKMAAAGTGSHEVLTTLLANDVLSVLDGRLSLTLAFLDHVAEQLEDELSRSSDVEGHMTAFIFGTNATLSIIDTADHTVKEMASSQQTETATNTNTKSDSNSRVRRQLRTSWPLGRGWSAGLNGVSWRSSNGRYTFNARPTFRPLGGRATFTIRF